MILANETNVQVSYFITAPGATDCGTIDPLGIADLPAWDNTANVTVSFAPVGIPEFTVTIPTTQTGNQVEMALTFA